MKQHRETRTVPYASNQMFDLVADIEAYPEFVPWCAAARLTSDRTEGGVRFIEADLVVSFRLFRETLVSGVTLDSGDRQIHIRSLRGPLRKLDAVWKFNDVQEGTRVEFEVAYVFRSRTLEALIGRLFDVAMQRIVAAFLARADSILVPPGTLASGSSRSTGA